jgi:hypothetical protein
VRAISAYTGRSRASIARDLDRFIKNEASRVSWMGRLRAILRLLTEEAREFMQEGLPEDRTRNATQLAEVLGKDFGVI